MVVVIGVALVAVALATVLGIGVGIRLERTDLAGVVRRALYLTKAFPTREGRQAAEQVLRWVETPGQRETAK
ncbi:MAG: hypothetical protein KF785_00410 [Gemmatimonadales bacterium]|nr:hypothetical protein [Gemmatimonadales bacterium]